MIDLSKTGISRHGDLYVLYFYDVESKVYRKVVAKYFRQTYTQHDRELEERLALDHNSRRKLKPNLKDKTDEYSNSGGQNADVCAGM